MEKLPKLTGMSKKDIERMRQKEIEDAWRGLTLGQAISSAPPKKNKNEYGGYNSKRPNQNYNDAIHVPSGSNIDFEMDMLDDPDRLAQNLHHNYDIMREDNALDDELDHYISEVAQKYNEFDEESKETDYWDVMHHALSRQPVTNKPAYPGTIGENRSNVNVNRREHIDERPIRTNSNGQYNLNFIDWNNEWERAYEAMDWEGLNI